MKTNFLNPSLTRIPNLSKKNSKVPSEEVKHKETEIRSMIFDPADARILLFNPIKKLREMAELARITYTDSQVLDIGLTVIRNSRDFEKA